MVSFGNRGSHGKARALFALLALALASLTLSSAAGVAAPTARPSNTAEPEISGRAEQGRTLSASRGRWTGTGSLSYAYRWVRCGANGGRPDGSDCGFILGATRSRYEVASADVGSRLRVRVTATNAFSYAWLRCNGAGGECAAIAGASGRSYRLTSSDVNHRLRVNVTARNGSGRRQFSPASRRS